MTYLRSLIEFAYDVAYAFRAGFRAATVAPVQVECPDFIEPPAGTDIAMPDGTPIYDELLAREFAKVIDLGLDAVLDEWSAEA